MTIFHEEDLTISEIAFVTEASVARGLGIEAVVPLWVVRTLIHFEDMEHQPIVVPNGSIHHRNRRHILRKALQWSPDLAAGETKRPIRSG